MRISLTFSWRGRYHTETSVLICFANQKTGFYMITSSVLKELTWIQAQRTMRKKQPQEVFSMKRCARVSSCRAEACNFIKKETLAQVFSCEFCEISNNTFVTEHLWKTASDYGTTFWHCLANARGKWDISLINV